MNKPAPSGQTTADTGYNYCALPLAPYACVPEHSKGRMHEEPPSRHRTCFQRDRDRIIHSSAFRRLKYKTQVFVYHEGDHYRTRLTHTLEVAQIARSLARSLFVNEDLAETVALSHDLGHTPFAHAGEDVLKKCMEPYDGFEHNAQSLRILTHLEEKYPKWAGLNLTFETLEGVIKHNGPIETNDKTILEVSSKMGIGLTNFAPVEAQVAALADDIAYNNHDVEDGLNAGLFTLNDISSVKLIGRIAKAKRKEYPDIPETMLIHEIIREMIGEMANDVLSESQMRLKDSKAQSPDDVRGLKIPIVAFSIQLEPEVIELKQFLMANMYRHYTVDRIRNKVEIIIADLFRVYMERPNLLDEHWRDKIAAVNGHQNATNKARIVADYIAGMTDRYAIREHERLFDLYWDLK
ncbi:MAG: deoxyguanosinetriphosphate triphosphohydrolase [Alphaproteobacteria bacterium]|nr:deoxyguanosinetriphosphate triphosphohydrolase [Alphaproteobacteria bacterium]